MNPLETLKQSLQNTLAESQANHEYNTEWLTSIQDGIYSCGLSVIVLEQWLSFGRKFKKIKLDYTPQYYKLSTYQDKTSGTPWKNIMSLTNLKLATEIKLQIELDAWKNGEKQWNVSNQFNESVLESALENYDTVFDTLVDKWQKEGSTVETMQTIGVMDWAFCLSEFQPEEIDSAWID